MKKLYLLSIFLLPLTLVAQNTIGLLSHDPDLSYDGYNLLYPHNQSIVYLIDNCGRIVHTWPDSDDFVPGNSAYLTEEGNLIKCKRRKTSAVNDPIWAGGGGEIVEVVSWDNSLMASFELNDSLMRLHHDIALMPNGNILMIAWENKTKEESITAGRDTSKLSQEKLWPEVVLEWNPSLDSIVWSWKSWDHLIQDYSSVEENYGVVQDHPELIDLNYDEHDGHPDWLHINAIDYNPVLDQIVLSVPYFNELWVIDHSTSSHEAAGHTGGNANKGGDLLYRWGNDQTYALNQATEQKLFFQHDVHWAKANAMPGEEYFGDIVLFNNRVTDDLSTACVVSTTLSDNGIDYNMEEGVYGPSEFKIAVSHPKEEPRSNSSSLSSAQLLPNDNILICAGRWGFSYEVTPENDLAWEYVTPIKTGRPAVQGDTMFSINNNLTFRLKRYPKDFKGFEGQDLGPKGYIELSPDTTFCGLLSTSIVQLEEREINIWPNPTHSSLTIESREYGDKFVQVFNLSGVKVMHQTVNGISATIDLDHLSNGIYLISIDGALSRFVKM